jgi:dephospho-CoA kinase
MLMKLIGLGGGIGAGKSTVSSALAQRGAVIVDADLIARQVVEPGMPALDALVERFGSTILRADGSLDRAGLAAIAFRDSESVAALNAITHPAIGAEINRQIRAHDGTDRVVVLDAALLFDRARDGVVGSIVVDVDPEVAVERLVRYRNFDADDARRRIAAQMSREDRVALADRVIDNSTTVEELEGQVDAVWEWIQTRPESQFTLVSPETSGHHKKLS